MNYQTNQEPCELLTELEDELYGCLADDLSNEHLLSEEWEEWSKSLEIKECMS
jgi:hypothetical protein